MIPRLLATQLRRLAGQFPVVTVTGPRQSGKTTLCRAVFPEKPWVSLEDPDQRRFAIEDPRGFLQIWRDGAIFDEFQNAPDLPSYLQGMVDSDAAPGRFILTGSQHFAMMHRVSQSLAGRTAVLHLLPFSLAELEDYAATESLAATLLRGFMPRIHDRGLDPWDALGAYFATYIERDLLQLTAVHDLQRFDRFVRLVAGRVGQLLNLSNLASDAGIAQPTARAWLDLLQTSWIVFLLPPWFVNRGKRLVKSPKLYFADVGLAARLLGLREEAQVRRDPLYGALFENLVVAEALKRQLNAGGNMDLYFYRDSGGNEIDLMIPTGGGWRLVEAKAGATVNPDCFNGLKRFSSGHPDDPHTGCVVFGGDASQPRSDWPVFSWRQMAKPETLWANAM